MTMNSNLGRNYVTCCQHPARDSIVRNKFEVEKNTDAHLIQIHIHHLTEK